MFQVVSYRLIEMKFLPSSPARSFSWKSKYFLCRCGVIVVLAALSMSSLLTAVLVPQRYRPQEPLVPTPNPPFHFIDRRLDAESNVAAANIEPIKPSVEIVIRRTTLRSLRGGKGVTLLRKTEFVPTATKPGLSSGKGRRGLQSRGNDHLGWSEDIRPPHFREDVWVVVRSLRFGVALMCILRFIGLLLETVSVPTALANLLIKILAIGGLQYTLSSCDEVRQLSPPRGCKVFSNGGEVSVTTTEGESTKIYITSRSAKGGSKTNTTTVILPKSVSGRRRLCGSERGSWTDAEAIGAASTIDTDITSDLHRTAESEEKGGGEGSEKEKDTESDEAVEGKPEAFSQPSSGYGSKPTPGDTSDSRSVFRRTIDRVSSAHFRSRVLSSTGSKRCMENSTDASVNNQVEADPHGSPADGILLADNFEPVRAQLSGFGTMSTIPTLIGTLRRETLHPTPVRRKTAKDSTDVECPVKSSIRGSPFSGDLAAFLDQEAGATSLERTTDGPPRKSPFQQYIEKKRKEEETEHIAISSNPFSPGNPCLLPLNMNRDIENRPGSPFPPMGTN